MPSLTAISHNGMSLAFSNDRTHLSLSPPDKTDMQTWIHTASKYLVVEHGWISLIKVGLTHLVSFLT